MDREVVERAVRAAEWHGRHAHRFSREYLDSLERELHDLARQWPCEVQQLVLDIIEQERWRRGA